MRKHSVTWSGSTIGVDLGDRSSRLCVLEEGGEIVEEGTIPTTRMAFERKFGALRRARVVIETGTHANWVHDVVAKAGHEVVVANARKVRAISANERKCDELDARMLARLGRVDVRLLEPVQVRPEQLRVDMALIRARGAAVEARTALINAVRGLSKAAGHKLPKCSSASFHKQPPEPSLQAGLSPLMRVLEQLSKTIREYDKEIEHLCSTRYPQTKLLLQIKGSDR